MLMVERVTSVFYSCNTKGSRISRQLVNALLGAPGRVVPTQQRNPSPGDFTLYLMLFLATVLVETRALLVA